MTGINRNFLAYKAAMPRWLIVLLVVGSLAITALLYIGWNSVTTLSSVNKLSKALPPTSQQGAGSAEPSLVADLLNYIKAEPAMSLGIAFCSVTTTISALILLISLPIFLFSKDKARVTRAGGLVKTTLGFFVGGAGTIVATISFASRASG